MKYIIPKYCHYSNFIPKLQLILNCNHLQQGGNITFTDSCRYEIEEKSCVNKLFGFSFGIFGVHKNSVRFGWTYNKELNEIFIWKYVYCDGKLDKEKIFSCNIGETHAYDIDTWQYYLKEEKKHVFDVRFKVDGKKIGETKLKSNKWFTLTLGPYFGGNTRAPHKICIMSSK